jgi:2,3-bisphosphoglycerate-independent phosphoglycerate mutase
MSDKKVLLAILDGWGIGPNPEFSAIEKGNTQYVHSLLKNYPNATLATHGLHVGLPNGQMGNSEVGHMNIGAGRVVYQDLVKINLDIEKGELEKKKTILDGISYAIKNNVDVHLIGLVSDGGVHSHIQHLIALCKIMDDNKVPNTFVHAFTDGRDTDPRSAKNFLQEFLDETKDKKSVQLASLVGRYYAMDRDKRWDRIKKAYDLLVNGVGTESTDIISSLKESYAKNLTDEFIDPVVMVNENKQAVGKIKDGDVVLFFNFRSDRPREISAVLSQQDMPEFNMKALNLHFITMTPYDESFKNVHIVYTKENLKNTIGEVLADHNKTQLRIAETEKYAHVTFFFSGGREETFKNENRIMIPSPKVPTYDLKPEMSAYEVTDAVTNSIETEQPDFICLNYANSDMVGHTGVFEAAMKAVETVDICVKRLVKTALDHNYEILIIADHGNSDVMKNEDGSVNTAHSLSPVPIIWVSNQNKGQSIKAGKLADVAPTVLGLMGIDKPSVMEGVDLIGQN